MSRFSLRQEAGKLLVRLGQWLDPFDNQASQGNEKNPGLGENIGHGSASIPLFEPAGDAKACDRTFYEVKEQIFARLDELNAELEGKGQIGIYFKESGRLSEKRPYFYLKYSGEKGILFERSGWGWVMAPADKIAGRDLFLRNGAALDVVRLVVAPGAQRLRIHSDYFQLEHVVVPVYCERLMALLREQTRL